ncbi:MAG: hypothetical protein GXO39_08050 [Thermotogae bacterium]|nr:hypothetical protein [Thermotogota bacterium]
MGVILFLWGFAEATLFFVVPDVPISFLATRGIKRALIGSVYATMGAVIGGFLMYLSALIHPEATLGVVERIPAISWGMIERVMEDVSHMGAWAMFKGAFSGVPYKVYASVLGASRYDLSTFLLLSFPARLMRFAIVSVGVGFLARIVPRRIHMPLLAAGWMVFYGLFWYFMEW